RCVAGILKSLGYINPVLPQSMYIFKQPSIGGEVLPHQDGTYLYTEPQSVIGFWWALEDCTPLNGRSSLRFPIREHQRFLRTTPYDGRNLTPVNADKDQPLLTTSGHATFDISNGKPILTKKGDLVLLHHAFVHYSHANKSLTSRHAYAIHAVESHETKYPSTNWLQFPHGTSFPPIYDASDE
ncbi:hypothetical protein DYB32_008816, partial [Aphanomyces invadans]